MSEEAAKPKLRLKGDKLVISFETKEQSGWPAVKGTFRPAMPREVRNWLETRRASKDPAGEDAAFYAAHVISWDVEAENENGEVVPVPVAKEAFLQLPAPVWDQFESVVLGYSGETVVKN